MLLGLRPEVYSRVGNNSTPSFLRKADKPKSMDKTSTTSLTFHLAKLHKGGEIEISGPPKQEALQLCK